MGVWFSRVTHELGTTIFLHTNAFFQDKQTIIKLNEETNAAKESHYANGNAEALRTTLKEYKPQNRETARQVKRQSDVPVDVVFARVIHNVIANLIMVYAKMKLDYSKRHRHIEVAFAPIRRQCQWVTNV